MVVGDLEIKDYATITTGKDNIEKVYLWYQGQWVDITQIHWPLALDPFVFGIWVEKDGLLSSINEKPAQRLSFTVTSSQTAGGRPRRIASLTLVFFDKIQDERGALILFKISRSRIFHLHPLLMILLYRKYFKKAKSRWDQFKILVAAYSYPRIVKIISFRAGDYYNIFPMDLLGEIPGANRFVFGLRHTNITLSRIMESGKLVVSECSFNDKEAVYQLGKHHGGTPPSLDSLSFTVRESQEFGFYIPDWVGSYREIRILKTMNLGSHMLLWGASTVEKMVTDPSDHLFHIHFLLHLLHNKTGKG
jgi:hypothetical protein